MWTYDGREFAAPTFQLGMAPAGSMYSTVARPGPVPERAVRRRHAADGGRVVKPETLEQMWTPQFAEPGAKRGFGLGFSVGELDGHRRVGHGGAIYGFATDALGAARREARRRRRDHHATAPTPSSTRIADAALRLAARREGGQAAAGARPTTGAASPRSWRAGSTAATRRASAAVDLARARRPALPDAAARGGLRSRAAQLRRRPGHRRRARHAARSSTPTGDALMHRRATTSRAPVAPPAPAPAAKWRGPDRRVRLGPQHALHPREGRQAARADRVVLPLPADGRVATNVFALPRLRPVPRREADLHARRAGPRDARSWRPSVALQAAARRAARRAAPSGSRRVRPVDELRARGAGRQPAVEKRRLPQARPGRARPRSTRRSSSTSATPRTDNFLGTPVYTRATRLPAAAGGRGAGPRAPRAWPSTATAC